MTISLKYTEIQKVLAEYADKELVSRILKEFEFGKVLFGDKFSQFQRKPKEHDTKPEEVALDDIVTFIDGSGKTEKQRIQKAAPFYKSIKSKAPKILKQPEGWVFRGTKIRAKTMFTMFETKEQFINSFKVQKIEGKSVYKYIKTVIYKPRYPVTSWSQKFGVATRFDGNSNYSDYSALYATKTNNNFLFNPEFLNKISSMNLGATEFETISTNESHKCLLFLTKEVYDNIIEDLENRNKKQSKTKWWTQGF